MTSSYSQAEFLEEYPYFSNHPAVAANPTYIDTLMARMERLYVDESWGVDHKDGVFLATAHYLELDRYRMVDVTARAQQAASGQVTPIPERGLISPGKASDGTFPLTHFGVAFLDLQNSINGWKSVVAIY